MRIFAAVASWIFWLCAAFCTAYVGQLALTRTPGDGLFVEAPNKQQQIFLIISSFLLAVGAFIARRIIFFHKRHVTLDEIGGVFLWLCLSAFGSILAFSAIAPGVQMFLTGEPKTWVYVAAPLSAFILLLALPLLPPEKGRMLPLAPKGDSMGDP